MDRKAYLKEYGVKWYAEVVKPRREKWFAENGPCRKCGSWDRLELDHVDPATKVHHAIWSWSEKRRSEELKKCQPLCRVCHKKKSVAYFKEFDVNGYKRMVGPAGTGWCAKCKTFVAVDKISKNRTNWNGLEHYCKACRSKRRSPKKFTRCSSGGLERGTHNPEVEDSNASTATKFLSLRFRP